MKKYIIIGVILVALAIVGSCAEEEAAPAEEPTTPAEMEAAPNTYIDVSPAEAKALIDENPDLIIIDVSPHYDDGHLPGAVQCARG